MINGAQVDGFTQVLVLLAVVPVGLAVLLVAQACVDAWLGRQHHE